MANEKNALHTWDREALLPWLEIFSSSDLTNILQDSWCGILNSLQNKNKINKTVENCVV